jgi:hypothetical protein
MSRALHHAINETLLHHGSANDAVAQLGVDRQAYKDLYLAVEDKIPGLTLPFPQLLANDPIECDPLVSQGNLAIMRLDDLYRQVFAAWLSTVSGELVYHKRSVTPGSIKDYTVTKETTEYGGKQSQPDASLLNQAINVVLASFRIQATITHRRDKLKGWIQEKEPKAKHEKSAEETTGIDPLEIIGPEESLQEFAADNTDQAQRPAEKPISRINPIRPISPIKILGQETTPPTSEAPPITQASDSSAPPRETTNHPAAPIDTDDQESQGPYFDIPPYHPISYRSQEDNDFLIASRAERKSALKPKPEFHQRE